jgi:hypothetical protein
MVTFDAARTEILVVVNRPFILQDGEEVGVRRVGGPPNFRRSKQQKVNDLLHGLSGSGHFNKKSSGYRRILNNNVYYELAEKRK